jgi:hypothetical protein
MTHKVTFSTVRPGKSSTEIESEEMDAAEKPETEQPEFVGLEVRSAKDGRGWVVTERYSNAPDQRTKYADNSALAECLISTGQAMKRDAEEDDSEPDATGYSRETAQAHALSHGAPRTRKQAGY